MGRATGRARVNIIRPVALVDVWPLAHSLYARQAELSKPVDGVRTFLALDGGWRSPELRKWKILANLLSKGKRLLAGQMPNLEIVKAALEMLDAGAATPWIAGKDDEAEVHVGIVTNPGAQLCAGIERWSVGWGEAVLSMPGSRAQHCAVNFGEMARVHLILTLRPKSSENEQA